MKNTSHILAKSIALLASLGTLQTAYATNAILSDDTTINRAIPRASYHTQPTLGVVATSQGVGRMAYIKFDFTNLPMRECSLHRKRYAARDGDHSRDETSLGDVRCD